MKRNFSILSIFLLTLLTNQVKADSWADPEWKEMIDSSDVIALVEYTSSGKFQAKAKPLKVYKGILDTAGFWISGFSNRYGPIDLISPGDKYVVFLKRYKNTISGIKYWQERIKEEPEQKDFYESIIAGNAYFVRTPTSGDLKVKGKKVQYDLLQTTYYTKQRFHPLSQLEELLNAKTKLEKEVFHKKILPKVKRNAKSRRSARHLVMLYLSSLKQYDPIFKKVVKSKSTKSNFALAKLLGQMEGKESRDLLVQLLDKKSSIVQGEVVRQLSTQDPELLGPILLAHLSTAGEGGIYPTNMMDPVMNRIDGGKVEIIRTLGEIKYKQAAKELLPLLETEDDFLFELVIDCLDSLGSREYIPYINNHLKKGTKSLWNSIGKIIATNDLQECRPALMEFISNHNRSDHYSSENLITDYRGLGNFKDQETVDFLVSDFQKFNIYKDTLKSSIQNNWFSRYVENFSTMKIEKARAEIFEVIYDWHGLNIDFSTYPQLFDIKMSLEDSLEQEFLKILGDEGYELNHVIAFITNTKEVTLGHAPKVNFLIEITIPSTDSGMKHIEIVSKKLNIAPERIYGRYNNGWYYYEKQDRFDDTFYPSPLFSYIQYAKAMSTKEDLAFLYGVEKNKAVSGSFEINRLKEAIKKIEEQLKVDK